MSANKKLITKATATMTYRPSPQGIKGQHVCKLSLCGLEKTIHGIYLLVPGNNSIFDSS